MAKSRRNGCGQVALTIVACVLACIGIAACGGSSKNDSASTTDTSTSSSTTATPSNGGQTGAATGRFAAVRSCLQKEGINLPAGSAGQRPPGAGNGGPPHGGGSLGGRGRGRFAHQLPKGLSREKLTKALSKCGAHFGTSRQGFFHSSKAKAALEKFAQCMSENGVKLPAPNTSGHGPVFDTKGIDTAGSKFKDAEAKCQTQLPGRFGRGGAPPPPGQSEGA